MSTSLARLFAEQLLIGSSSDLRLSNTGAVASSASRTGLLPFRGPVCFARCPSPSTAITMPKLGTGQERRWEVLIVDDSISRRHSALPRCLFERKSPSASGKQSGERESFGAYDTPKKSNAAPTQGECALERPLVGRNTKDRELARGSCLRWFPW